MLFAELLSNALSQMLGELLGETLEQKLDRRLMLRALRRRRARQAALRPGVPRAGRRAGRCAHGPDALRRPAQRTRGPARPAHVPVPRPRPAHDQVAPIICGRAARTPGSSARRCGCAGVPRLPRPGSPLHPTIARAVCAAVPQAERREQPAHGRRHRRAGREPAPAALPAAAPAERSRSWHNLPQRSYTRFVGRQAELEQLNRLLLPHPRSRHFVVTLDGIGRVGKSALALELAYRYREGYAASLPEERFEAIICLSAKRTLLTAGSIQTRQQTFITLSDLYREIAMVLEQPAILQSDAAQQRALVERALMSQRTLLLDNLETIDDEDLLSFLRELPDPTKVIVTTRHRIDIAYAIRLSGMPQANAQALMLVEAARQGVALPLTAIDDLYRRSGGVALC